MFQLQSYLMFQWLYNQFYGVAKVTLIYCSISVPKIILFVFKLVMIEDALNIYHHFIALDASHSLDVDETMLREIERRICTEDGSVDADCFHIAQNFAFDILRSK